jgi:hypothetical protein
MCKKYFFIGHKIIYNKFKSKFKVNEKKKKKLKCKSKAWDQSSSQSKRKPSACMRVKPYYLANAHLLFFNFSW